MTTARSVSYIGGATVLVAWLASASAVPEQRPTTRARPGHTDEVVLGEITADVQSQAARLRQRLAAAPAPAAPLRNPFSFHARDLPKPRGMVRAASVEPEPVATPSSDEVPLALLGIAEQQTPGGLVRTAMIGGADDTLHFATEGQDVAGRYRVTAVGPASVELKDLTTGVTRRLALRSPAARP